MRYLSKFVLNVANRKINYNLPGTNELMKSRDADQRC